MRPGEGYTQERIRKMIASMGEQDIQFPHYLPVHLTYQTAFVDDDGRLEFREDMYGRDQVLIAILRGEDRKIVESPVDRREGYSGRAAAVTPGYYQGGYYQGGYQNNGGNFFSRPFGGGFGDAQPVPRRPARSARPSAVGFSIVHESPPSEAMPLPIPLLPPLTRADRPFKPVSASHGIR